MDNNYRVHSKKVAWNTIKNNSSTFLLMALIAFLPQMLCAFISVQIQEYFLPSIIIEDMSIINIDALKHNFSGNLLISILTLLFGIIFFPLTVSFVSGFDKLVCGEKFNATQMFEYFSTSTFKCFALRISIILKYFLCTIPYILIFSSLVFVTLTYILNISIDLYFISVGILNISVFIFVIIIIIKYLIIECFEKIAIININNDEFDRKQAYKLLKTLSKNSKKDLFMFNIGFLFMWLATLLLAPLTLGLSFIIANAYYLSCITVYASMQYKRLNTKNTLED